jgi:hypothetical protein
MHIPCTRYRKGVVNVDVMCLRKHTQPSVLQTRTTGKED